MITLRDTKRFECPLLKELLGTIRMRRRIPDALWDDFKARFAVAGDVRLQESGFRSPECLFAAKDWNSVAREQLRATRAEAAERGAVVHYVFSVDRAAHALSPDEAKAAWQHANSTDTGRLVPILGLYVGMRVRLMARIARHRGLVNDAPGTVVGFNFHEKEDAVSEEHLQRGWRRCKYLPAAVLVEFDDHIDKCGACKERWGHCKADCGANKKLVEGTVFVDDFPPGVVPVEMRQDQTKQIYLAPGQKRSFQRRQIPLSHLSKLTSQGVQGGTFDWAIVNATAPDEIKTELARAEYWAHLYVMISRVRRLDRLLILNPPANLREFLEAGPPEYVLRELERVEGLAAYARRTRPGVWRHSDRSFR